MIQFRNSLNKYYFPYPTVTSSLSADRLSHHSAPQSKNDNWNLRELEEKIKKDVKKQVSSSSMSEEMKTFYTMQKWVLVEKFILMLVVTSTLCYAASIRGAVIFRLFLFVATEILTSTVLSFTDLNMIGNIRKIQPILYCSIFYSLLKWMAGVRMQEVDWSLTFLAIIATLAHCTLNFYKPFRRVSTNKIASEAIRKSNFVSKLSMFSKYIMERIRMASRITRHSILVVGALCCLILLALTILNKITPELFQPRFIILSFPLFILLEAYVSFLDYVNMAFSIDHQLIKVIKDKTPVFLNLLRLEANPFNRLVQLECLKCLFVKLKNSEDFLSTETCKSLIYSTYMDIFNQYASIQLNKADQQMEQILLKIKNNDKTINLQKSLLEDLLIYFKKFAALIQSEWECSKFSKLLADLSFLLLIINSVGENQDDEKAKLSRRVIELTERIRKRVKDCGERTSLSQYTRGELSSYYATVSSERGKL